MRPQTSLQTFSIHSRTDDLQRLDQEEFDLLIIGGGITGAGIALDAVSRGLKVALVEKKDYAWGTSSRSTKLVHGGLRYLKQMEFKLVREVGLERAIVHNNARHIVISERMLLPIIKGGSLGKNMSSLALWIYDRLAKVQGNERRKMLNKNNTIAAEPLLRQDLLKGGGLYYEYRTDDARLTIENLKTAVEKGAIALNYCKVQGFEYQENGQIKAAKVQDLLGNKTISIKAKSIVSAAGPWVDQLRALDSEGVQGKRLHLSKGVHIVVDRQKLPIQQAVYFDVEGDKRMVFAIPRAGITYLGTTDTDYGKAIDQPKATKADVEYILKAANFMFPEAHLKLEDVQSSWAGLRPLIHQEGKSASELSRKDEIFESETGLISIAGGKLTGYRKMAERIVNLVCKRLNIQEKCKTKNLRLTGGDFDSNEDFQKFIQMRIGEAKQILAKAHEISLLAYRYGANIDLIIEKAFEWRNRFDDPTQLLVAAEIHYGIQYEQLARLSDFLIRRTGRLYFERPFLEKHYKFIAAEMGQQLNWNASELEENLAEFEVAFKEVMDFG
jgi:glycerol-3-phosphate dehydrogenase